MKNLSISLLVTVAILLGTSFSNETIAQKPSIGAERDTANFPFWTSMMQDPEARFSAVCSAFEKYWEGRTDYKGNGWKVFKRWEYINRDRVQGDGKLPAPGYVLNESARYVAEHLTESTNGNWTQIGPTALPGNSTFQPNGMGRINALAFHPTDANIIYAGAPSGGLWKTSNGGSSWTVLTSTTPTLGVSAVLLHPSNTSLILIGTGDRDGGDAPGLGVYGSSDGGATWTASNTGMGNLKVGMMLRHPSSVNTILAATSGGIYKSTDGGANWSLKSSVLNFKDIKFKPGDPTIVYATENGNFYRSTNTGESWSQITSGVITGTRMVIGVSANAPSTVYLLQTNGTFAGLLRSTNSGVSFSTQSTSPNLMDYACNGSGTSSQAWYDLCIAVDPSNANIIYTGGVNIWKSTDAGVNWTINSHWVGASWGTSCAPSVHADIHCLDWSPVNGKLYNGNDGGVYWTSNGGSTWTDISSGLAIAQVYKIGQSATNASLLINGYQDNGTATNNGTTFTTVIGGDGMECIIDYSNSNNRFGALYYGDIRRSTGGSFSTIGSNGTNGITEKGGWVTPYIQHATVPATLFAGYKNVWRTTNANALYASSVTWTSITSGITVDCKVLEQSPANVDILYAVWSGSLLRTDNANATSPVWVSCTLPGGLTPTDLEAHPTNQSTVYATAGTKVYKSTNKGGSWTDISGTLPAVTINCIVYDVNSSEGLYIGNMTNVYFRDATMSDWIPFSTGLPTVDVRELEIWYSSTNSSLNRIKAATYGRGLWESDLYTNPFVTVLSPNGGELWAQGTTHVISWNTNTTANVSIDLYKSGTFFTTIHGSAPNTGNYQWLVPPLLPLGSDYKVKITSTTALSVNDISDAAFSVVAANPSSNSPVCFGTPIQLTCSGMAGCGMPGAVYTWTANDNIFNSNLQNPVILPGDPSYLSQRFYLTILYPGGTASGFVDVIILPAMTPLAAITNPLCFQSSDGAINLQINGGLPPYYYIWSNGMTTQNLAGLSAGNYSVTVTDSQGCIQQAMWMLTDPAQIGLTATITPVSCTGNNDGSIAVVATGGTQPLSCLWTTGDLQWTINNLTSGNYGVTVTDANFCPIDSVFVVTQSSSMCAIRNLENITILNGMNVCYNATQTIQLAGNNSYFNVQSGGQVTLIAGINIQMLEGTIVTAGGNLSAYIAPSGPWCVNPSIPEANLGSIPLFTSNTIGSYRVFPNPVKDELFIERLDHEAVGSIKYDVHTLLGKRVVSGNFPPGKDVLLVSLSEIPSGIYVLRIFSSGSADLFKIIKINKL